jgi:quinoprotein dehydrogenase-associated probable ABC transporter substrate-binding protein
MRALVLAVAIGVASTAAAQVTAPAKALRVCADPANLPFSDAHGDGFEDRLAEILARDLGATVETTLRARGRAFLRETLAARRCDVVLGVPVGLARVRTTRPYYRSAYVFVTRRDRRLALTGLDDPRLRALRIGLPLVGDDGANPPAERWLAARGIVDAVVGFPVAAGPIAILDAVSRGAVDVAIVWGPLAGWYARRIDRSLELQPIRGAPPSESEFSIAIGVRRDDVHLAALLDGALERRRAEIAALLADYGVPLR